MKFVFSGISLPIVFDEGVVNSLVIENQRLLYSLIEDISNQLNGSDGDAVLSRDNVPVDISKNLELITSFIPFEVNKKALVNKIISAFEKTALNEAYYMRTSQLTADLERLVSDIAFDFPCEVECDAVAPSALFKAAGLRVSESYSDPLEKILDYMELVREFDRDKLFAFVNMRAFFSDERMEIFIESVIDHKFNVLLVDSSEHERLNNERRLIIDADLCEI